MRNKNRATSIRARLLNHARKNRLEFDMVLTRFCLERLLYRISISKLAENFLLKRALLFDVWFDIPHRPTRDIDFLGFGSSDLIDIEQAFRSVCIIDVDDGVIFKPETVSATEIRKDKHYVGARVNEL